MMVNFELQKGADMTLVGLAGALSNQCPSLLLVKKKNVICIIVSFFSLKLNRGSLDVSNNVFISSGHLRKNNL